MILLLGQLHSDNNVWALKSCSVNKTSQKLQEIHAYELLKFVLKSNHKLQAEDYSIDLLMFNIPKKLLRTAGHLLIECCAQTRNSNAFQSNQGVPTFLIFWEVSHFFIFDLKNLTETDSMANFFASNTG